jgi:hypothetical protein
MSAAIQIVPIYSQFVCIGRMDSRQGDLHLHNVFFPHSDRAVVIAIDETVAHNGYIVYVSLAFV